MARYRLSTRRRFRRVMEDVDPEARLPHWKRPRNTQSEARKAVRGVNFLDLVDMRSTPRSVDGGGHYTDGGACWCDPRVEEAGAGYVIIHSDVRRN